MMIFHNVMMILQKVIMILHDVMMTLHNIVMVLLCDDDTSLRYDEILSLYGNLSFYGAGTDPFFTKKQKTNKGEGEVEDLFKHIINGNADTRNIYAQRSTVFSKLG